ncbi:MAG: protein kinase domain-containing protein [Myxococcaceae bacterium]
MAERYRLKHLVETGGMAEVYLGLAQGAEGFEKQVVIKRVHPHLAKDPRVVAMFLGEARLARHLHHQNIVEVLDVGVSPDGLYLVMELVDGWSLAEIISQCVQRSMRVPAPLAGYHTLQVVAGLTHAYGRTERGRRLMTAHRDISPSNVLVSTEGEVKVADFGVAKLEAVAITEPGTFKGKVGYAAPEMLRGEPATEAADQFGLGVVLYELLAGRHPFGNSQHLIAYVEALRSPPPPLPPNCGPLAGIVGRMLAKAPGDRFSGAGELSRALAGYLANCGVPTSSGELARFISVLEMAPPFGQRQGSSLPGAVHSFSLAQPSSPRGSVSDFELDPNWQPSGPVLDESGSLSGGPERLPAQAPVAKAAEAFVPEEEPLELDRPPRELSTEAPGEALPETPVEAEAPRGRSGLWFVLLAACVLFAGGVLAAVFLGGPQTERLKTALGFAAAPKKVLYLDSNPPGAMVQINGVQLGTTPLIRENLYQPGAPIEFKLSLKGYKPAKGTFTGGEGAERFLELERR